jgi:DNA replicative helicase MCM subunit Mcm2 (Cdc46/Mcm family)
LAKCVQASNYNAAAAQMPHGFPVVLMHELADCCQVGDEVEVTGVIVQQAQGTMAAGAFCAPLACVQLQSMQFATAYMGWLRCKALPVL